MARDQPATAIPESSCSSGRLAQGHPNEGRYQKVDFSSRAISSGASNRRQGPMAPFLGDGDLTTAGASCNESGTPLSVTVFGEQGYHFVLRSEPAVVALPGRVRDHHRPPDKKGADGPFFVSATAISPPLVPVVTKVAPPYQ